MGSGTVACSVGLLLSGELHLTPPVCRSLSERTQLHTGVRSTSIYGSVVQFG